MLPKHLNKNGQKAYQRNDNEDRSLPYRNWLRTVDTAGFFLDVDFIKWRIDKDNRFTPCAITELTRTDSEKVVSEKYLQAIIDRFFGRDKQGEILGELGRILGIPVYLVLFPPSISWLYVFSFRKKEWRFFEPDEWVKYLKNF